VIEVWTRAVTAAHASGLVALFQRTQSPCFCRFWHFRGDKNQWLDRCFNHPEESQSEMLAALRSGNDEMRGVVALSGDGSVVGWMKLALAASVPKLYEQRLYRGLPCFEGDRAGIFTVGCFLVDEAFRRKGLATALLRAGVDLARSSQGRAIEAFPRRLDVPRDDELWTGPTEPFERLGFRVVHDFRPYPVMRLDLGPG
jgi:GNAT superfamily N-acetyltransferase